jgi:hypothetical protein
MALVSSGFIARLDFGELARWGREKQGLGIRAQGLIPVPSPLPLTLLVLGILADDANDTTTMDHLALVADRLYGCTDLH